MPGGIPSGSDPSQLTPHPFSILGAGFGALNTRTETNVRAALEQQVKSDPDLGALSDQVFAGIDPALGMVAGVIEAIARKILGLIPFIDLESEDAPAVQVLGQIDTFFTHWREFLGDINFLDPDFDLGEAQESFAKNVIQPFLDAVSDFVGSFIPPGLLPLLPIGQIGAVQPNLFLNGDFTDPVSVAGGGIYTHDASVGRTALGSARTVASGTTRALYSNPILVGPNQKVDLSIWFKTTGVVSGANGIQLRVRAYNNSTPGADTLIQQATPAGTANWAQLSGQYVTPASGVTSIVVELRVTTAVTSGIIHLDDASAIKAVANNLLPQEWISGLQNALSALTSLVDFDALKNILGAGASTLTAIGNRLNFLNPNGTFDASQLANMTNLPAIPDGLTKIADLNTLSDAATNALSGLTTLGSEISNAGLNAAKSTMKNIYDMLAGVTRDLQALQSDAVAGTVGGRRFNINFADYPNGAFPSNLFQITYTGAGTGVLAINGGKAVWNVGNSGYRRAFMLYAPDGVLTKTDTDFQVARGTMGGPPEQGTNVRIWAVCRSNAAGTSYVFARGYCTGFLSYKGDIGCVVNGVETVWQSGVPLTWSLDMRLVAGVGNNPRRYQVLSGSTVVVDMIEPGTASQLGENFRYWGACSETNGGKVPGSVVGASIYDNAPPAVVGSSIRISRRFGGDVTIGSGGAMVPNNFYETTDYITPDITYSPGNNCRVQVSVTGTYICAWAAFHGPFATGTAGAGLLFRNGAWHTMAGMDECPFNVGFGVMSTPTDRTAGFAVVALQAGDYVNPGFYFTNNMSNTGDTATLQNGARTYFSMTRVGI